MGRPTVIDKVVAQRTAPDGSRIDITTADQIIGALRTGAYFEHACAAGGITKETGYEWQRIAASARRRTIGRDIDDATLTDYELQCIRFSDGVVEARDSWIALQIAVLEQSGRGGIPQVTTTVKEELRDVTQPDGSVKQELVEVERQTRTSHTLPDVETIKWRLTRMRPDLFGHHVDLRLPDDDASIEDRARDLLLGIEAYRQDVDAAVSARTRRKQPAT